jgi:hypothetical protein
MIYNTKLNEVLQARMWQNIFHTGLPDRSHSKGIKSIEMRFFVLPLILIKSSLSAIEFYRRIEFNSQHCNVFI